MPTHFDEASDAPDLVLEILESLGNLAGAEFLPFRAFLGFFCKISTPEVWYGSRHSMTPATLAHSL